MLWNYFKNDLGIILKHYATKCFQKIHFSTKDASKYFVKYLNAKKWTKPHLKPPNQKS
jgi:hypothetical protein